MSRGTLLVCHAGADLGIGHLTRMLAVAAAMRRVGNPDPRFLIAGDPIERDDLAEFGHRFVPIGADLLPEVDREAEPNDVVVLDLHPRLIPESFGEWADTARGRGVRLVGVDALLDHCESLDETWVPSILVPRSELARCPEMVHFGWDSFLIEPPTPPSRTGDATSVLVLTGGSDVTGLHHTLPQLLDEALPAGTEVVWVQGPFAGTPAIPEFGRLDWRVEASPSGLGALMARADLAITVFGVTVFEALQAGLATVVFNPYEDRSFPELDVIDGEGVAIVAHDASTAVASLADLVGDPAGASELGAAAARRMAVSGAERLALLIHSLGET